jgi:predicted transposase YdaD
MRQKDRELHDSLIKIARFSEEKEGRIEERKEGRKEGRVEERKEGRVEVLFDIRI